MLSYIKSELYRIAHGREIYLVTAALAGLMLMMNLVLFIFDRATPDFPYATVQFSMNTLISSLPAMFLVSLVMVNFLFGEEYRNGTLKNLVSFGIPRIVFFVGKCTVCLICLAACLAVVLPVYIGSAYLLLHEPGFLSVSVMLRGVAANIPASAASAVLAVTLLCLLKKEINVVIWWMAIMWGIPTASFFIGLKVDIVEKISEWMPWNYLQYEVAANMSGVYKCLWETHSGLAKCIIAGLAGIIIFTAAGIAGFRKKEIQ